MSQIKWSVDWMKTTPTTATPPEFVLTAGWRVTGTQTQNDQTYTASAYGTVAFAQPESANGSFTPYDQLTETQVLGWVWTNGVDKATAEASINQQIADQINPKEISPPLPWAAKE